MAGSQRLDRLQRAHHWVGFPIAVVYKFFEDHGSYLAALMAYYAFVSLFPLLLLATTILGFVLKGDPELQERILNSALSQFPVVGHQLEVTGKISGGTTALVVGIVGSLYGAMGVAQAGQYAMNTVWNVPRNNWPNPFVARGRSLLLLATAGLGVIGTTVLSTFATSSLLSFGLVSKIFTLAGSLVLNAIVFIFCFRFATARDLSVRDVAPGAVCGAVVWQLLQTFGVAYVNRVVRHASDINGVFALVLGLLAFLYLAGAGAVMCAEINVVRVDRLYPRALLTPFTDNVRLTAGDRRTYTHQAAAERAKGFQTIDVTFIDRPEAGPAAPTGPQPGPEPGPQPGPEPGPAAPPPASGLDEDGAER